MSIVLKDEKKQKVSIITELIESFERGENVRVGEFLGVHQCAGDNHTYVFRTYVPRAQRVELTGDFNSWGVEEMTPCGESDIWECTVESDVPIDGMRYQYRYYNCRGAFKASDLCSGYGRIPGRDESVICTRDEYEWRSRESFTSVTDVPVNIMCCELDGYVGARGEPMNYRDISHGISETAVDMGYTHVLIRGCEDRNRSVLGVSGCFFVPSARFGRPEDVMYMVDQLHSHGLGAVISMPLIFLGRTCALSNQEVSMIASCIVSMSERFRFDGIELTVEHEASGSADGGDIDLFPAVKRVVELVRASGVAMFTIAGRGIPSLVEEQFDLCIGTRISESLADAINADEAVRRFKWARLNYELMNAFERKYIIPLSPPAICGREIVEFPRLTARLKLTVAYLMLHPGKKLFDGFYESGWLGGDVKRFLKKLNQVYVKSFPMWKGELARDSFEWICHADNNIGVSAFVRRIDGEELLAVFNFENEAISDLTLALDNGHGCYERILDTDGDENTRVYTELVDSTALMHLELPPFYAAILSPASDREIPKTP